MESRRTCDTAGSPWRHDAGGRPHGVLFWVRCFHLHIEHRTGHPSARFLQNITLQVSKSKQKRSENPYLESYTLIGLVDELDAS